jgi:Arc/MetJ-type ribon-helix-helix transcriptional regulator
VAIQLTPEQERRIQSLIDRGAYETIEETVESALTALEGTSGEVTQAEFWASAKKGRSELLEGYKRKRRS